MDREVEEGWGATEAGKDGVEGTLSGDWEG